jgi:hypothetical protein
MLMLMQYFQAVCPCRMLISVLYVMYYPINPVVATLPGNPVPAALPGNPVPAALPGNHVPASCPVLFCISFHACPDLPVLFRLSSSYCPVLNVTFWGLSCSACPVLVKFLRKLGRLSMFFVKLWQIWFGFFWRKNINVEKIRNWGVRLGQEKFIRFDVILKRVSIQPDFHLYFWFCFISSRKKLWVSKVGTPFFMCVTFLSPTVVQNRLQILIKNLECRLKSVKSYNDAHTKNSSLQKVFSTERLQTNRLLINETSP